MKRISSVIALAAVALSGAAITPRAEAGISINIGAEPVCPYGYYDYPPYACAPYGYYGPEWFSGGVFIGAGPWFHGPADFYGHADNRFDPRHGYGGPLPERGERRDPMRHVDHIDRFHGNAGRLARRRPLVNGLEPTSATSLRDSHPISREGDPEEESRANHRRAP